MGVPRKWRVGPLLATTGVLIVLATVGFHGWLEYARPDQNHEFVIIPLVVGAILGWWGFYLINPKMATDGAAIVVDAAERLKDVHFERTGRRSTDPVVVIPDAAVVVPTAEVHPDELPDKEKGP